MLGILARFLQFMQIEQNKIDAHSIKHHNAINACNQSQTMMSFDDEKDNIYSQSTEIVSHFENGKELKMEVITEIIPVSKTNAIRKTTMQRIR